MTIIVNSPAGSAGACLSCNWRYIDSVTCPDTLTINVGYINATVSVDFAGRGKKGGNCPGTDQYVTYIGNGGSNPQVVVDVWGAYQAGVWTSSTTIKFYLSSGAVPTLSRYIGYQTNVDSFAVPFLFDVLGVSADPAALCPTTLLRTITVLDDGTAS